ncbi:hypothetical protein VST7929_00375 [Vibrio stylophorae]|uniref:O-antigen ligase-related domain-containing protein n=1 Tax=Vibrio stylophorae TaxID=659351 RepID=A0ABM8ZRM6_9VIBR|nr:O-antigen ligase family protein [Vibrio stylophorae]CAH0532544.1 hypothetical protein VST7929_00375 [Vibrio stylophorae]
MSKTLYLQGTQLEPMQASEKSLALPFFTCIALFYLGTMHYFQPHSGREGLELPFNVLSILPFGFAIVLGIAQAFIRGNVQLNRYSVAITSICLLLSIPFFYSTTESSSSLLRMVGLWSGGLFFIAWQQIHLRRKNAQFWLIVSAAVIETLFVWGQRLYFTPELSDMQYGIFEYKESLSAFLLIAAVLSCYLYVHRSTAYRWSDAATLLSCVLFLSLLLEIHAFKQLLIFCVSLALLIYGHWQAHRKKRLYFLVTLLATAFVFQLLLQGYIERLSQFNWHDISSQLTLWQQTLVLFLKQPWLGYGYGNFGQIIAQQYAVQGIMPTNMTHYPSHPNSELLYWVVEGGVIPLIGCVIFAYVLISLAKSQHHSQQITYLAIILPLLMQLLTSSPFENALPYWLTFLLIVCYFTPRKSQPYAIATWANKTFKFAIPVLCITLSLFVITALHTSMQLHRIAHHDTAQSTFLQQHTIFNTRAQPQQYQATLYQQQLALAVTTNDLTAARNYLNWAKRYTTHRVELDLYRDMLIACYLLKDDVQIAQIQREAAMLFPNQDVSMDASLKAQIDLRRIENQPTEK